MGASLLALAKSIYSVSLFIIVKVFNLMLFPDDCGFISTRTKLKTTCPYVLHLHNRAVEEDGKTFLCDKRERDINCVFIGIFI